MPLEFNSSFKVLYWTLAILGGLWALFVASLTNPTLQRHTLYAHKLHSAWWQDVSQPEKWGFLKNQIRPFNISTPDGETLYAWHVLPIGAYRKHEASLLIADMLSDDFVSHPALDILTSDPASRLVISFHGNAGHVGQGWRTDAYRALTTGSPSNTHVLAFDYRGFGLSTGSPSEAGLITDGIAAVTWALDVAQLPPHRIALVGQSLGTAVATAVAEHFSLEKGIDFAGVGLISPFSGLSKLLGTYAIGGWVPILSPLMPYPRVREFMQDRVVDTWLTSERMARWVRGAKGRVNLVLVHAYNDFDIHWSHSDELFYVAANATAEGGLAVPDVAEKKMSKQIAENYRVDEWNAGSGAAERKVRYYFVPHGGHNRVTSYPVVSNAVLDLFEV